MVKGRGAYSRLKYESGVHRVQRVPATEDVESAAQAPEERPVTVLPAAPAQDQEEPARPEPEAPLGRAGVDAELIGEHAGGNPFFSEELAYALREGIYAFNVESVGELHALSQLASTMDVVAPIALRVNPDVVSAARSYFLLPEDDERLAVVVGDGDA